MSRARERRWGVVHRNVLTMVLTLALFSFSYYINEMIFPVVWKQPKPNYFSADDTNLTSVTCEWQNIHEIDRELTLTINPQHPFSIVLNRFWFLSKDPVRVLNSNVNPAVRVLIWISNSRPKPLENNRNVCGGYINNTKTWLSVFIEIQDLQFGFYPNSVYKKRLVFEIKIRNILLNSADKYLVWINQSRWSGGENLKVVKTGRVTGGD